MNFLHAQISGIGGRPEQQDALACVTAGPILFAIVCDGLGGHTGGEQASRMAVESAVAAFQSRPAMNRESLIEHLAVAHKRVQELQTESAEFASMRTTAIAVLIDSETTIWAHVGDSRLYHFRDRKILTQTRDHSVPQRLAEAGEIDPAAIRFHEDRNRLLRALGSTGDLKVSCSEATPVQAGDAFLLCTDGFWEWVLESEMEAAFDEDPEIWLQSLEAALKAKATGDFDNYSAIAISLRQ